ncbi:protein ImuB [Homoserinimonas aerilata]|uniref:Protein ImuB n=1 Tax=Homoserinimonas aerilata TaxID=1162970 RepID=A0A542YJD3_9MICO|nr:DNA polymerase Y family protein [Homoserinimonas aerilata]TQL48180.1 protein ImuB [Homoserinimonas aerilata]
MTETAADPLRALIVWLPDWPISAARMEQGLPPDGPLALVDRGHVVACSESARREGVRRGLRLREAQLRCPELVLAPYDATADARAFDPVVAVIEQIVPGVQILRPGLCAVRARGAARYYGGEQQAAERLLTALEEHGLAGTGIGIADSLFAAEQAVWQATAQHPLIIVPAGESARFLAGLPIEALGDDSVTPLLRRLGARTLGDFAALSATDVRTRFGETGARAHARAGGNDPRPVIARVPPRELDCSVEFEPPLDRVDQIAFGMRAASELFITRLTRERLVCTGIRITVTDETGVNSERGWAHPRYFTAADVLDRVRWQLQGDSGADGGPDSPVARVQIAPEHVDAAAGHEEGLWGQMADERIHHGLSRIQSMLGHEAVLTAVAGGGRLLAERRVLVPWGDAPPATARAASSRPWPGSLPDPQPTTVFETPQPVTVLDAGGTTVDVDRRGSLSGAPTWLGHEQGGTGPPGRHRIAGWAGPWPLRQRWWDPAKSRRSDRFQILDDNGTAWLLLLEQHCWWAEGRYD